MATQNKLVLPVHVNLNFTPNATDMIFQQTQQLIQQDFNAQNKSKLAEKTDSLKELEEKRAQIQRELDITKLAIKEINLKHTDNPNEEPSSAQGMSKIMDPAGSKLILKVSEIVYRYKPLTKDDLIDGDKIKLFYSMSEVEGGGEQFFNSKQESAVQLPNQQQSLENQKLSNDGKSDASSSKKSKQVSRNYVFKEKFAFTLTTGQEQLSLKVYSSIPVTQEQMQEQLEQDLRIKVSDELVQLIDQNEHVKIIQAKNLAAKIIIKWVFDQDVEKLAELQLKQIKIEQKLYKVEGQYQQTLKSIQMIQQQQPTITNIQENWGVFLVTPNASSSYGGSSRQQNSKMSLMNSQQPSTVKKVKIDLNQELLQQQQQQNDFPKQQFMAPTHQALYQLNHKEQKHAPTPQHKNRLTGSIMDSILQNKTLPTNNITKNAHIPAPRSQACSTGSMFSQMRAGTFFKMVDSPFKMSLMSAYDKMGGKGTGSVIGAHTGSIINGQQQNMIRPQLNQNISPMKPLNLNNRLNVNLNEGGNNDISGMNRVHFNEK